MRGRKAKRKRGRPPKINAKRNTTTREGRATGIDPVVLPTDELRAMRRAATSRDDLPHDDPLAALYGHNLLTTEQYNTARTIAELISQVSRGGGVSTIWQRILGAPGGGYAEPSPSPAAERAARMVRRLARELGPQGVWLIAVCSGAWLPWIVRASQGHTLRTYENEERGQLCAMLDRVARFWSPTIQ
jgi:hypothetical protein